MTTDTCAVCGARRHTLPNVYCTKCNTTAYCSLKCQKTDKKAHKQTCGKPPPPVFIPAAATTTSPTPTRPTQTQTPTARRPDNSADLLTQTITKPFTHIDQGTYLHNRPREDVYALLIDTYRLRLSDVAKH